MQYQDSKRTPKPLTDAEWEQVCPLALLHLWERSVWHTFDAPRRAWRMVVADGVQGVCRHRAFTGHGIPARPSSQRGSTSSAYLHPFRGLIGNP